MCKISANARNTANLQKIRKLAKNLQICNELRVGISIKLKICKKSADVQKIYKSTKIWKSTKKISESAKNLKNQKNTNVIENSGNSQKTLDYFESLLFICKEWWDSLAFRGWRWAHTEVVCRDVHAAAALRRSTELPVYGGWQRKMMKRWADPKGDCAHSILCDQRSC